MVGKQSDFLENGQTLLSRVIALLLSYLKAHSAWKRHTQFQFFCFFPHVPKPAVLVGQDHKFQLYSMCLILLQQKEVTRRWTREWDMLVCLLVWGGWKKLVSIDGTYK